MKKILMIFSRPPYPLISGDKIRMYQNLKILSTKYKIDILFINEQSTSNDIKQELHKHAENIYNFDFNKIYFLLNTLLGVFFNKKPLQVNYYYFRKIQKWINTHVNEYDAVYCSSIRTSEYVYKKNIYKIIDYIDAISMNYQKAYEKSNFGLWRFLYKIDKEKLIEYERKMLNYFDQKIIISDVDRNFILNGIEDKHFHTLYNSVNTENLNNPSKKEDNYIIFTGKMDYEPNINAVKYFSSKIFPAIQNKYPDIQFIIAGVNPAKSVKKLALNNKNIIVTGYVMDLNSLILNSKLVVAPMISGAGIQNKILHAMALKKCVISTPIGAEGLNKLDKLNAQIVISDNITKMIEDILNLLMHDDTRIEIGIAGFEYVKNNFSQKIVEEKLLSIIKI